MIGSKRNSAIRRHTNTVISKHDELSVTATTVDNYRTAADPISGYAKFCTYKTKAQILNEVLKDK